MPAQHNEHYSMGERAAHGTRGWPCVHAEVGFADAAEMLAKARIVARIGRIIQARKLTQAEAGELLSTDQ